MALAPATVPAAVDTTVGVVVWAVLAVPAVMVKAFVVLSAAVPFNTLDRAAARALATVVVDAAEVESSVRVTTTFPMVTVTVLPVAGVPPMVTVSTCFVPAALAVVVAWVAVVAVPPVAVTV